MPLPSSAAARRFRKPERKSPFLSRAAPWPSSMRFWVSKWLRLVSSVPANGTKASWRFW